MNWYALLSLVLAGSALLMGNLVYGKNPRSSPARLFLALSISVAFWGFIDYGYRQAGSEAAAALLLRFSFPSIFAISFSFHFILSFTEKKRLLEKRWVMALIYAPAFFFTIMNLATGSIAGRPYLGTWGWTFNAGGNLAFYALVAWGMLVSAIIVILCVHYYFSVHESSRKNRAFYGALGFAIGAPTAFVTAVLLPTLDIDFPPMVLPAYALVCTLVGYGMWKHKLFALTPTNAAESIVNTMSDALLLIGMDRTITMVNRAASKMLGYSEEELLSKTVDAIFPRHRDHSDPVFREGSGFRGLVKAAIKGDVEAQLQSKSGGLIDVSIAGSLIRDADNDLLGIVCIARDISERKRARERLAKSEARYRLLVENAPVGIISIRPDGSIRDVNASLANILGSPSLDATREINVLDFPPLIQSGIADDLKSCLQTPRQFVGERLYNSKWGRSLYIRYYLNSICDEHGQIAGVQAIAEDITEQRRTADALERAKEELEARVEQRTSELKVANESLREQIAERELAEKNLAAEKEQLAVTLRSIGDGVITTDTQGRIVLLNRVAEALTGLEMQEACGRTITSVYRIAPQNEVAEYDNPVAMVIRTGSLVESRQPVTLIARDGLERMVAQSCAPIRDEENTITGAVLVFRDITERERLEHELFRARKMESVGLLAGGIAHDFNNILTGIITNLFVAKMQIDTGSETYQLISEAEKSAVKAGSLTKQLLAFSQEGMPVKAIHSMREVIEDSIGFFLSGSNVDYTLDFPDDLWKAEIDRGQIDQALQSVIRNADQAMPEGGTVTIRGENVALGPRTTLPLRPGRYLKIGITDEGRGIPEQDLERIFDPYFTTKEQGSGLGLAAAYALIRKHDGHIHVASRMGEGTTVSLYLPAFSEEKQLDSPAPPIDGVQEDSPQKARVLIMDDEEIVRLSGSRLLGSLGYRVQTAQDGAKAVEMYMEAMQTEDPFDVVILDLTVPGGMGARETIVQLLKIDPEVKAIACSGYSSDPIMDNYHEAGFIDVIAKPYKVTELSDKLQSFTQSSPLAD